MHKPKIISKVIWINSLVILLTACSSSDRKQTVFGDSLPTIKQVYQQQLSQEVADKIDNLRAIQDKHGDLQGDSLISYRHLRQQFPRLPNPALLLYVYPHLTPAGTPVPGYYTVFPFYREQQYALPGDGLFVPSQALDQ